MSLDCVVEDDQLSLAIGKKGQNVRLRADRDEDRDQGETEVKGEVARRCRGCCRLSPPQTAVAGSGIGEKTAERLAGRASRRWAICWKSAEARGAARIGEKSAEKILEAARALEEARAGEKGRGGRTPSPSRAKPPKKRA
jgi:hypothetical protein